MAQLVLDLRLRNILSSVALNLQSLCLNPKFWMLLPHKQTSKQTNKTEQTVVKVLVSKPDNLGNFLN